MRTIEQISEELEKVTKALQSNHEKREQLLDELAIKAEQATVALEKYKSS